ncbi:MAG: class I SAM-dependent methyltransferase, partial [Methanobrevibacter sp.]|nr:class I SAM-dependent methyltransferase [Methanobrevibacter sp.]
MTNNDPLIFPAKAKGILDNKLRKLLQNPKRILKNYIKPGMTVIDLGCGPGFFTMSIGEILEKHGKVIGVDLQGEMLKSLENRAKNSYFKKIIKIHQSNENSIGLDEKADFILAFWSIHEIRNKRIYLNEIRQLLKENGKLYIVEPIFEVNKVDFQI